MPKKEKRILVISDLLQKRTARAYFSATFVVAFHWLVVIDGWLYPITPTRKGGGVWQFGIRHHRSGDAVPSSSSSSSSSTPPRHTNHLQSRLTTLEPAREEMEEAENHPIETGEMVCWRAVRAAQQQQQKGSVAKRNSDHTNTLLPMRIFLCEMMVPQGAVGGKKMKENPFADTKNLCNA